MGECSSSGRTVEHVFVIDVLPASMSIPPNDGISSAYIREKSGIIIHKPHSYVNIVRRQFRRLFLQGEGSKRRASLYQEMTRIAIIEPILHRFFPQFFIADRLPF